MIINKYIYAIVYGFEHVSNSPQRKEGAHTVEPSCGGQKPLFCTHHRAQKRRNKYIQGYVCVCVYELYGKFISEVR